MKFLTLVVVVLVVILVFCVWRKNNPRIEGIGGSGGLSTINSLAWYNSPSHCWKGLYDDGEYCATNSALML